MTQQHPKPDRFRKRSVIAHVFQILNNPVGFLEKLMTTHGPVVFGKFGGKHYCVLQDTAYIKHVLLDNHRGYNKPGANKIVRQFVGDGLLTANGARWKKKRRQMQPAFHKQKLIGILDIINEETTAFLSKLSKIPPGTRINISQEMLELNISIVSRAMFSTAIKEEMDTMVQVLEDLVDFSAKWMKSLFKFPLSWPTPANLKFKKDCETFDRIIYAMIKRRKEYNRTKAGPAHNDLLDMLLGDLGEDGQTAMSNQQLRDEITTIFIAGHETTAQTLSWLIYILAKEKTIFKTLKKETAAVLQAQLPNLEHLAQLTYTKQVINEGLRVYPAIIAIIRELQEEDVIKGIRIPASSTVLVNIYGIHRHPDYWEQPNKFYPAHFSPEAEANRKAYSFLPFGGGPRLCIGKRFAMTVMQVVVSRLSDAFEFDVVEGHIPVLENNVALRAKGGLPLIIRASDKAG